MIESVYKVCVMFIDNVIGSSDVFESVIYLVSSV